MKMLHYVVWDFFCLFCGFFVCCLVCWFFFFFIKEMMSLKLYDKDANHGVHHENLNFSHSSSGGATY